MTGRTLFAEKEAQPPELPGLKHGQIYVYPVLADAYAEAGWWLTDGDIGEWVGARYEHWYGVGSIGARRREVNAALARNRTGWHIAKRVRPGHSGLWEYRLCHGSAPAQS